LVTGGGGRVDGGCEKGGEKVARTVHGRPGTRFHLAVDAAGAPLAVRIAPGNENEREHLLPLVDALIARGIHPGEVWADRGYDAEWLVTGLWIRGIRSQISKRRRAGDPIPPGTPTQTVWRGRKRQMKTRDTNARHRWPVERTNAWLKAKRRIATRRDRKPENYLAFLQLGMLMILARPL
jgi:transposase